MAVLGYLAKLKRGLGLAFGAHFVHDFSINLPYFILYQWKTFQHHTFFPSQDIKQNVFLSSYYAVDDVINYSNGWHGEKEGKTELQKFEYVENEQNLLDEIKNIFHCFFRAIIWLKIKI